MGAGPVRSLVLRRAICDSCMILRMDEGLTGNVYLPEHALQKKSLISRFFASLKTAHASLDVRPSSISSANVGEGQYIGLKKEIDVPFWIALGIWLDISLFPMGQADDCSILWETE